MIDYLFKAIEGEFGLIPELIAILALVLVINVLLKWVLLKLHARYKAQGDLWRDCLIMALIKPLTSLVWFIALVQALNFLWVPLRKEDLPYSPHTVILVGIIIATAWFFLRWKKMVVHKLLEKSKAGLILLDHGKVDAINKLFSVAIYLVTALLLLEQSGSSVNTLIAFGGVSGLAVAFASQQIIANFFGGIVIYFTKPFAVGDWIHLPEKEVEGYVEEIGWYTTRIRTFNKRPIYIPNSLLSNILVTNPSRMTHRQFKEKICLRYADLDKVHSILKEIRHLLHIHSKIDQHLHPEAHLYELNEAGIGIFISAYTANLDKYAYNDLVEDLLFKIAGIVTKHEGEFVTTSSYSLEFPKGFPQSRI